MTQALKRSPNYWLTLKDCEIIFNTFNKSIQFDQPFPPFETREPNKLEGIIESVRQTFDRKHLNPTVYDAASSYFNQLIRGHPFQNGNKRIAVLFTHLFLLMNGLDFNLSYKGLYNMALQVAIFAESGWSSARTKDMCKQIMREFVVEKNMRRGK